MYNGVWSTPSQVPKTDMDLMFEMFQHHTLQQPMHNGFAGVVQRWMPDIMRLARDNAITQAIEERRDPGLDGLSVIKTYNPDWIHQAIWDQLADEVWATKAWLANSATGKRNRNSTTNGVVSKHTESSVATLQHKFRLKKELEREPSLYEVFLQTHCPSTTEADGSVSYGDFITPKAQDTYCRRCMIERWWINTLTQRLGISTTRSYGGRLHLGRKVASTVLECSGSRVSNDGYSIDPQHRAFMYQQFIV